MAMNWVNGLQDVPPDVMAEHAKVVQQWEEAQRLDREAAEMALRAQSLRATAYFSALRVESALRVQFGDRVVDTARKAH